MESFWKGISEGSRSRLVSKFEATPAFSDSIRLKRSPFEKERWRGAEGERVEQPARNVRRVFSTRPGFQRDVAASKAVCVSLHEASTPYFVHYSSS